MEMEAARWICAIASCRDVFSSVRCLWALVSEPLESLVAGSEVVDIVGEARLCVGGEGCD